MGDIIIFVSPTTDKGFRSKGFRSRIYKGHVQFNNNK